MRRRTWLPPRNPTKRPRFSRRPVGPTADRVKIGPILPRGVVWNKSTLNPPVATGQGYWRLRKPPTAQPSARLHYRLREFGEEIVGCLLGRTVDQALPELGELAADLRLHVIGKERAAVLVGERHFGAALGEARDTTLAFAGDAVAVGRIEIGEPHLALPARLDRTDLDGGDGLELVVGNLVELLAARDAALEHLGVVELGPNHLAAGGELDLPTHGHGHRRSPSFRRLHIVRRRPERKALSSPSGIARMGCARTWRTLNGPLKGSRPGRSATTNSSSLQARRGQRWPCELRRERPCPRSTPTAVRSMSRSRARNVRPCSCCRIRSAPRLRCGTLRSPPSRSTSVSCATTGAAMAVPAAQRGPIRWSAWGATCSRCSTGSASRRSTGAASPWAAWSASGSAPTRPSASSAWCSPIRRAISRTRPRGTSA